MTNLELAIYNLDTAVRIVQIQAEADADLNRRGDAEAYEREIFVDSEYALERDALIVAVQMNERSRIKSAVKKLVCNKHYVIRADVLRIIEGLDN